MYPRAALKFVLLAQLASLASTTYSDPKVLDTCPGYQAKNVFNYGHKLTADLVLGGTACNVFGNDTEKLKLEVTYENHNRIHVKITDPATSRYEVPEEVLTRPKADFSAGPLTSNIRFNYTASPFSFSVYRAKTHEVLFSTASHPLVFEPQYLRVKTNLPANANIYGLGEHSDAFRLPTHDYTRTMWSRDAYGVPQGQNLYGNHPIYFEHRATGTHGVLLVNSNGMDIKLNDTEGTGTTLEYNVIGGVLDFYFLAGSESDPTELARQYADVVGTPAEVPYWSFGFHQCRFGYTNYIDVSQVITNYSAAGIPLETMWTDIDYMDRRRVFTVDPQYFPLNRVREIVDYLHARDQKYIVMTDPAVAYAPGEGYGAFDRGTAVDVWLKAANGSSPFLGAVWPGVTVFPDWFHPKAQEFWNNEFNLFYNPENGIDIDGVWIDMNEPASFCSYPCTDPFAQAKQQNLPPPRTSPPPDPNAPIFGEAPPSKRKRSSAPDHSKDNVQSPPYAIANHAGSGALSDRTAYTDALHANGLIEYDTHNLYGHMMSTTTQGAMSARRPGLKTLVITRSTFPGAGTKVGKWLGDNLSTWSKYKSSIAGILGMASIYQIPMVGADVCGFGGNTNEKLCARWAMLGTFYPFMRNHADLASISQEFYRWPTTAQAARNALDTRYRLIDYLYTTFHQAKKDGSPVLRPLWFSFPKDNNTFAIDSQFFFGPSVLVSPVIDANSTSVDVYYPHELFYDFHTLAPTTGGGGGAVQLTNVNFTSIPVSIMGGAVLPLRVQGQNTTTALRKTDFELVVAPSLADGRAHGSLYLDDGVSVAPQTHTSVSFTYENDRLDVRGWYGYATGVNVSRVRFANTKSAPKGVTLNGKTVAADKVIFDSSTGVLDVALDIPFKSSFVVELH